ncbi:MAG: class I SAM-dependent methyltransferase [Deltaproteobacteria bacterium]|nr:class I SAM-dependent methyltransferase [Deltaproteobacteria bacterium]
MTINSKGISIKTSIPQTGKFSGFAGNMETVACPVCEGPPNPKLIFKNSKGIGFWKCPDCRVMYASPRFTQKSLLDIYEHESFVDHAFYEGWSYEKWKRENRHRSYVTQRLKLDLLGSFLTQKDRILAVGCGTGLFLVEAQRRGFQVEGIEPSARLVEIGNRVLKVPIQQCLLEAFDPGYKYQGVVVWDVLEHVTDPLEMLRKCKSLLDSRGYLFVQVPNYDGLSNRMKTFMCRKRLRKTGFKHFGFPGHLYSFNRKSLSNLLNAAGFTPVILESWSHHIKEGTPELFHRIITSFMKTFCLSDYITCAARSYP